MSRRDPAVFLEDVLESAERISEYVGDLSKDEFQKDQKTIDAVVRNIEIIGEAVSNIPEDIRNKYPQIPWKKIVGVRNIVIHKYFGVDTDTLWVIINKQIPELKNLVSIIIDEKSKN